MPLASDVRKCGIRKESTDDAWHLLQPAQRAKGTHPEFTKVPHRLPTDPVTLDVLPPPLIRIKFR